MLHGHLLLFHWVPYWTKIVRPSCDCSKSRIFLWQEKLKFIVSKNALSPAHHPNPLHLPPPFQSPPPPPPLLPPDPNNLSLTSATTTINTARYAHKHIKNYYPHFYLSSKLLSTWTMISHIVDVDHPAFYSKRGTALARREGCQQTKLRIEYQNAHLHPAIIIQDTRRQWHIPYHTWRSRGQIDHPIEYKN